MFDPDIARIADALEDLIALHKEKDQRDRDDIAKGQEQFQEFVGILRSQSEYTQRLKDRMDREDMHRASCEQCKAHYYTGGRGN